MSAIYYLISGETERSADNFILIYELFSSHFDLIYSWFLSYFCGLFHRHLPGCIDTSSSATHNWLFNVLYFPSVEFEVYHRSNWLLIFHAQKVFHQFHGEIAHNLLFFFGNRCTCCTRLVERIQPIATRIKSHDDDIHRTTDTAQYVHSIPICLFWLHLDLL